MSEGVLGVLARRLHGVLLSQKPLIEMCWLPADLGVSVLHNWASLSTVVSGSDEGGSIAPSGMGTEDHWDVQPQADGQL